MSNEAPRLSVNINEATAEFLHEIVGRKRISYTEAVRRAVDIYKFFEDAKAEGRTIQTVNANGSDRHDVTLT